MAKGHVFTSADSSRINAAYVGEDPVSQMYVGSQPDLPVFVFFDPFDPDSLIANYEPTP
jgi:hypothetical protein